MLSARFETTLPNTAVSISLLVDLIDELHVEFSSSLNVKQI